jgi:O-antigen/teichoic acid export membrane protein
VRRRPDRWRPFRLRLEENSPSESDMAIKDTKLPETTADPQSLYFETEHLKVDLGGRTVRGGAVTIVTQGLKFLIGMIATVVLARLLTPQDYGLIGMAAVIIGFVSIFKDLGLSAATIQRAEINTAQISTLFWINVALSIAVMLVAFALSPLVALFYHEPRLRLITAAYGFGFLLGGVTVQHEALLRRQMRFGALALAEMLALCASMVTAITLAWYGAGYWALVASQLSLGLVYLVSVWKLCAWRPSWPSRNAGVRSMLTVGGNLTGFGFINYFARNLDNLLIGKFWGSQQLGLYAKAYQLLLLPIEQINSPIAAVALPALSRLTDSPERYRQAYLRVLEKLAILTMPGIAFMIATSDWMVRIVLGPQWVEAGWIFAILGVAGLVQPTCSTTGWLFITQNRTRHMFQWGFVSSTIIITSIVAGLPWGARGVSFSYSLAFIFVVAPLLFWFVGREGPVRSRDFYVTIAPAFSAAICVLVSLILMRRWMVITRPLAGLVIGFGIAGAVTLLVLLALPRGRKALLDFRSSAALLIQGKVKTPA